MTRTRFEYGAILKGSQTYRFVQINILLFEYGAILKGSQTDENAALRERLEKAVCFKGMREF